MAVDVNLLCYNILMSSYLSNTVNDIIFIKNVSVSTNYEKITLDINHSNKMLKLIAYYKPPESQKIKNIKEFLIDFENEISSNCNRIMLVGDVNIDLNENCRNANEYKNITKGYDLELINTNVTRDASWKIIGYVSINFADSCNTFIYTISLEKFFSDDNMITATIKDMELNMKKHDVRIREILNYEKLATDIRKSQKIKDIVQINDVNSIAESLTEIIREAIKQNTKTFKVRKKKKKKKHSRLKKKKFNFKNLMVKDSKVLWKNLNSISGRH